MSRCYFPKGHRHCNMIRSQCRHFKWQAPFFLPSISPILHKQPPAPPPPCTVKGAVRGSFFRLADRSGVEGWGGLCPLRRGLKAPTTDLWGLRAVFKVLITFTLMCSQEVHKCQHSCYGRIILWIERTKRKGKRDAAQSFLSAGFAQAHV